MRMWIVVLGVCSSISISSGVLITVTNSTAELVKESATLPDGQAFVTTINKLKSPAKLVCALDKKLENGKVSLLVAWHRNGKTVKCGSSFNDKFQCEWTNDGLNLTLILNYVSTDEDLGEYECKPVAKDSTIAGKKAYLLMQPQLEITSSTDEDFKPMEGKKVELRCAVAGAFPAVTKPLRWYWRTADSLKLKSEFPSQQMVTMYNDSSVLLIKNVTMKDRLVYVCKGENSLGDGDEAVFLRVKATNVIMWPAIGIVTEMIILLVIISVSEVVRYRSRKGKMEDDAPQTTSAPPNDAAKANVETKADNANA